MGRIVAYLGPETIVANPVEAGSYGLVRQAEACPDGFGIGWYPIDHDREPVRLRSRAALPSAGHLLEVPRRYPSACVVAEARSAQGPAELSGLQPLAEDRYLFSLDGSFDRFASVFLRPLLAELSPLRFERLEGKSPAELFFALWLDALDGEGPNAMATALEAVVSRVFALAEEADAPVSLALVLTDGDSLLALRTASHGALPPLYTTVADEAAPVPTTGRLIASEPTFPGAWEALEPHALIIYSVDPPDEDTVTEAPASR